MPLVQDVDSIAAGAVTDNILTGSQFEYMPYNAHISFALVADATNGEDLRIDVYTGQDVITENMIPVSKDASPVFPDDFLLEDVVRAGERVKVRVRNTDAANAVTLRWALRITPV